MKQLNLVAAGGSCRRIRRGAHTNLVSLDCGGHYTYALRRARFQRLRHTPQVRHLDTVTRDCMPCAKTSAHQQSYMRAG